MSWQAVSGEQMSQERREARARSKSDGVILAAEVRIYGSEPGQSDIRFSLPATSSLRQLANDVGPEQLVDRLQNATMLNVSQALQVLMVETGQLPPPGSGVAESPAPSLLLEILFYSLDRGGAEVGLSMPDPAMFRRVLADEQDLSSVASRALTIVQREVADGLRKAVLQRGLFSS